MPAKIHEQELSHAAFFIMLLGKENNSEPKERSYGSATLTAGLASVHACMRTTNYRSLTRNVYFHRLLKKSQSRTQSVLLCIQ